MFEEYKSILTVAEVAEAMDISRSAIYKMVKSGELPCIKIGKSVRFEKIKLIKAFEKMQINSQEEITDENEE